MTTPTPVTTAEARAIAFSSRDKDAIDAIISLADQLDAAITEAGAQRASSYAMTQTSARLRQERDAAVKERDELRAELERAREALTDVAQKAHGQLACGTRESDWQSLSEILGVCNAHEAAPRAERGGRVFEMPKSICSVYPGYGSVAQRWIQEDDILAALSKAGVEVSK